MRQLNSHDYEVEDGEVINVRIEEPSTGGLPLDVKIVASLDGQALPFNVPDFHFTAHRETGVHKLLLELMPFKDAGVTCIVRLMGTDDGDFVEPIEMSGASGQTRYFRFIVEGGRSRKLGTLK